MKGCNFINGAWQISDSGREFKIVNPANFNEVVLESKYADVPLAMEAVEQAYFAWKSWKFKTIKIRIKFLQNLIGLLEQKREWLAKIITYENGKLLSESLQEIDASINESKYQIDFISQNYSEFVEDSEIRYEPLGVALLITPWNFPVATVLRKMIPAILLGNTAVIKASENVPFSSSKLFELIEEAGFPKGVVNLVNGYGAELVPSIIRSKKISVISFTGSTMNGKRIAIEISDKLIKYQAEMGGVNTALVLNDADIDMVARSITANSFACAGQWCTGTGKVIAEEGIYDNLLDRLTESIGSLKLGMGLDNNSMVGPMINMSQLEKTDNAVKSAVTEGAQVVVGGKKSNEEKLKNGAFYEPTLITGVQSEMKIFDEEIFGPVITLIKIKDFSEAVNQLNKSKYGLSFSVFGEDSNKMEKIISQVDSGLVHINLSTPHRSVAMPLLGWKDSGFGYPESGRFARDFFSRTKAVYRRTN